MARARHPRRSPASVFYREMPRCLALSSRKSSMLFRVSKLLASSSQASPSRWAPPSKPHRRWRPPFPCTCGRALLQPRYAARVDGASKTLPSSEMLFRKRVRDTCKVGNAWPIVPRGSPYLLLKRLSFVAEHAKTKLLSPMAILRQIPPTDWMAAVGPASP